MASLSPPSLASGPPDVAMHPCATMRRLPASQSMMPKPVRSEPGSRPRMRAEPVTVTRATAVGTTVAAGRTARQADRIGYRAKCLLALKKLRVSYRQ